MADFSSIVPCYNSIDDHTVNWVPFAFGGSGGSNELRWCSPGAGAAGTASAAWPQYSRPGAVAAVGEAWVFASDASGTQVDMYDGGRTYANQFCISYDATGHYAAAPTLTAYSDNTHTAPSPGTQPGTESGSPIINGANPDTGTSPITSYLKGNLYGDDQVGNPAAGTVGTTLAATTGTLGSVSPGAAAWLATWQSLQGVISYVTHRRTPAATTAGKIFFTLSLWTGPSMSLGLLQPSIVYTYSYV